ncbi:MAG: GTP-binding protein [Promethearchaeota archaeon]
MKLIQIAGFLGSGKTTMILNIAKKFSTEYGKKTTIIVNDFGEVGIDGEVMKNYGLDTMEITGGCVCCTLATSLVNTLVLLEEGFNPDIVILEPSGVAYPSQVTKSLDIAGMSKGLTITTVDISRFEEIIKFEGIIIGRRQVKEADIVVINKVDLIDSDNILDDAIVFLKEMNPNAEILNISAKSGQGIDALINRIL